MKLTKDDPLYSTLSDQFVVRYVARIARILDREPLIKFNLDDVGQAERDLLFTVCFEGVVNFEDPRSCQDGGRAYRLRPVFQGEPDVETETMIFGDTAMHGLIDDPILELGIQRAKGH